MAGGGKGGRSGGRERKLSAKGLRIARRMRLQVPLPPEPKWKRKRTAAAMQVAIAEWKLERKPAPPAAKLQRKPGTAARPPRRRRSRATSISSRAGRRRAGRRGTRRPAPGLAASASMLRPLHQLLEEPPLRGVGAAGGGGAGGSGGRGDAGLVVGVDDRTADAVSLDEIERLPPAESLHAGVSLTGLWSGYRSRNRSPMPRYGKYALAESPSKSLAGSQVSWSPNRPPGCSPPGKWSPLGIRIPMYSMVTLR